MYVNTIFMSTRTSGLAAILAPSHSGTSPEAETSAIAIDAKANRTDQGRPPRPSARQRDFAMSNMKQIAAMARVSLGTVSNVLNDTAAVRRRYGDEFSPGLMKHNC